jgi:hypothetical protein
MENNKNNAKYLAELAIVYAATGFQLLAKNRKDLAAYYFAKAAEMSEKALSI